MADTPFLKPRSFQFRGPKDSSDYNSRVEETYRDATALYNRARLVEADQADLYRRAVKDLISLSRMVDSLSARIKSLENTSNIISFSTENSIDNDRFVGSEFEIPTSSICYVDPQYGVVILPKVETSSLSKLFYTNTDDLDTLPSTLETRVVSDQTTADSSLATIDTSDPELSIVKRSGRIWERNVIVSSPDSVNGAQMFLYLKIPTDLFTTDKSNAVVIHPYPVFGEDILDISYTSAAVVLMDDSDNYISLNYNQLYSGDTDAIGWIPPGGWTGDTYTDAGLKIYYFDPTIVTGLRIKLRQKNYFKENSRFIYSYGLSKLDLRFDKFLSTGKTMIRFDAPAGTSISSIDDIEPDIWNVPEAVLGDVYSYRILWETAYNSQVYTLTPVPLSQRIWIELTLNQTSGGGTPSLSGLTVAYS